PDTPPAVAAGNGPARVVVSPDDLYAFVTNTRSTGPAGVSEYQVGSSGQLIPDATATVASGANPVGIAIAPNGEYAYVANNGSSGPGGISQYTIGAGGTLAPDAAPTVDTGPTPKELAISPNGDYLYVTDDNGDEVSQYEIGAGGELTPDPAPTVAAGTHPLGLAIAPDGQYLYVANSGSTGPDGVSQYAIGSSGGLTPDATASVAAGQSPLGVAVSPDGDFLYVTDDGSTGPDGVSQYAIGADGELAPAATPSVSAGATPLAVAVAPDTGPLAQFAVSAAPAGSPTTFTSQATDADEAITGLEWSFGDGANASGPSVTHVFAAPGSYTVTLTATDAAGCGDVPPLFAGDAGPFTGMLSACSPDAAAQASQVVTISAPASTASTTAPAFPELTGAKVKRTLVDATIACDGAASQSCYGTLTLRTTERLRGRSVIAVSAAARTRTRTVTLGSGFYDLAGGASATLPIALDRTGLALLARLQRLPARLSLPVATTAGADQRSSRVVTFRVASAKTRERR
ncbi:MAG TPA: beta-propeller fold lactonase family protein, partial [Solirubrobacteraceae bacterium]|nr:beta-propeller fold lactonase family protein [Solirubrobacteraceae bacterium]